MIPDCSCPRYETWRDWSPWCPVHGIEARIEKGIWHPSMRDLWNKARLDVTAHG